MASGKPLEILPCWEAPLHPLWCPSAPSWWQGGKIIHGCFHPSDVGNERGAALSPQPRHRCTPSTLSSSKNLEELKPSSTINTIYIPGNPWGSGGFFNIYGLLFKVHSWSGFSVWPWLDCPLLRQSLSSLIEWAAQVAGWGDSFWQLPVVKCLHVKYLLLK